MKMDNNPISEIKITPEMIEAGETALAAFNSDYEQYDDAACRIYTAMEKARVSGLMSRSRAEL